MFNPSYLMLSRHQIYYFRWPLPRTEPCKAPRYIRLSLRTREPYEALRLARALEYYASSFTTQAGPELMNHSEAKAIVTKYCQRMLEERKRQITDNGGLTPEQEELHQSVVAFAATNNELAEGGIEIIDSASIERLAKSMGINLKQGSPEYHLISEQYRKAMPAFSQELMRFGNEIQSFDFSPVVTPAVKATEGGTYTLSEMTKRFIDMEGGRWQENTLDEKLKHFQTLAEIIGPEFKVTDMNAETARMVRDTVARLPKNRNKIGKLRGLSLEQAMMVPGVSSIAPATLKKYIETYNSLFKWCVDESYIDKNHFANLRGVKDKRAKGDPKRQPFKNAQVLTMLAELDKREAGLAKKDYQYWGILIAAYTGARLNEIAQIELKDIQEEDGVWFFDMNDDGDRKKLKTAAARRKVPIHSALIERGLLAYSDKLRKEKKTRLLHELTYCRKSGYGKNLGRFFNEKFLPDLKLKRPELVFHSFRHTVNTMLRNEQVSLTVVQSVIGHERSGGASETYFGSGYTLPILKEAIEKVVY
jgi:integrase